MTLSINLSVFGLFFMLDWTDDKYHRENVWSNTKALFFPSVLAAKNPPAVQEMQAQSLGWEDPLRRKWQPAAIFFLELPWAEEPGRLQSIVLQESHTQLSD